MDDMTNKTVPVEPIIANLPKAIWLNVGELDPLDAPYDFDEINSHEDCVTWCDVPQDGFDIKYVRADLAEAVPPSPVTALLAAFDKAVADELPRVSHAEYDSHEICKHFASQVRARIAFEAPSPVTELERELLGVIEAAQWFVDNPDSPKSALGHITEALAAYEAKKEAA